VTSLQKKWDERYRQSQFEAQPAKVLLESQHLLPVTGYALDLACGLGSNALLLSELGLQTTAWDISSVAIEKLLTQASSRNIKLEAQQRDVIEFPPVKTSFDVILVCNFLERSLCPQIIDALKPGGLLLYQTYCRDKVEQTGPANPDFLLKQNELLRLFSELSLRIYREEHLTGRTNQGWRNQAMLVAQKPID
jgi:SAM-dependent methyltransferase